MNVLAPFSLRLLCGILGVYRLAQLVALDTGPFRAFERLRAWAGTLSHARLRENLGGLVHCPYCLGMWFALPVAVLVLFPSVVGDVLLLLLALAGGQAFLEGLTNGGAGRHP